MKLRHRGTDQELMARAQALGLRGRWRWVNEESQLQFRTKDGDILNWWPSTGTVQFQGCDPDRLRTRWREGTKESRPARAGRARQGKATSAAKMRGSRRAKVAVKSAKARGDDSPPW